MWAISGYCSMHALAANTYEFARRNSLCRKKSEPLRRSCNGTQLRSGGIMSRTQRIDRTLRTNRSSVIQGLNRNAESTRYNGKPRLK